MLGGWNQKIELIHSDREQKSNYTISFGKSYIYSIFKNLP